MAMEDFSTYTETDPNAHISVTSTKVQMSGIVRNETAMVVKDKGAGWLNTATNDFVIDFTVNSTSGANDADAFHFWLSDMTGTPYNDGASVNAFGLEMYHAVSGDFWYWTLQEYNAAGTDGSDQWNSTGTANTIYYARLTYTHGAGANGKGQLALVFYTNSIRTSVAHTFGVIDLNNTYTFRYVGAGGSRNDGGSQNYTGYTEEMTITITPVVYPTRGIGADYRSIKVGDGMSRSEWST